MSSLPASVPFVGDVQYRRCVPSAASDGSQLWLYRAGWALAFVGRAERRMRVSACALVSCCSLVGP
eukprot:7091544-Prymnesium_polylepis.1